MFVAEKLDIGDVLRDGATMYRIASFIPDEHKVNILDFKGRMSTIDVNQAIDMKYADLGRPTKSAIMRELCKLPEFDQMTLTQAEVIISDIQGWWDKATETTRLILWGDSADGLVKWYTEGILHLSDIEVFSVQVWNMVHSHLVQGKKVISTEQDNSDN